MKIDEKQIKDIMMQDEERERKKQRSSLQAKDALVVDATMQRQKLLFDVNVLKKQEHKQEQY